MRTGITLLQSNILDANVKTDISWLFEIDVGKTGVVTFYWSTKDKTWNGQAYTFKVLDFSDINIERGREELGVQAPSSLSFTTTNPSSALRPSDFANSRVTIRLVVKADLNSVPDASDIEADGFSDETLNEQEAEISSWSFDIQTVTMEYQKLKFKCQDIFTPYLEGTYPNTKTLAALWPSTSNDGSSIVPLIFGTAYIPIATAYIGTDRYYVLGAAGHTYSITKSRSPIEYGGATEWLPASYTFNQYTVAGSDGNNYQVFQLLGTVTTSEDPSNVLYHALEHIFGGYEETVTTTVNVGNDYLALPTLFSRDDTAAYTSPADIISYVLQDFGVPADMLDATTLASVKATYASWGLTWQAAFYNREDRKAVLARLLQCAHLELIIRDKIYFKIHSKTSQYGITSSLIIEESFSDEGSTPLKENCGYVLYPTVSGGVLSKPLTELNQVVVAAKSTATIVSDQAIDCSIIPSSVNAQAIGQLVLQRRLLPTNELSFKAKGKILQCEPDDVVTIMDQNYGAGTGYTYDVLIDSMQISRDLEISVRATRFSAALDDFTDLSPTPVSLTTDNASNSFSVVIAGPDSPGQTGSSIPNLLPGCLRVGSGSSYIYLNPFEPVQSFIEGGITRLKIGDLGTDDWGIEFFDHAGVSLFKMDGSGNNTFAGFAITGSVISCDSGVVGLSSVVTGGTDWRIWAGHATPASAPFRVDESGNLVATSATITGAITATSGSIGSFTIGTYLYTGTKTAYNDTNAGVHLGSDGIGIGNNIFTVSSAGALVATSATITGDITATTGYFASVTLGKTGVASGTLTLQLKDTGGDTYIAAGKTDFTNTDAGFILGLDDSDSNKAKLYLGDTTSYFSWDGSALNYTKGTVTEPTVAIYSSGTIKTHASALSGSAGIVIQTDGIYAGTAAQTTANANVRILATGSAYFAGDVTANTGYIGGTTNGWQITAGLITALGTGLIQTSSSASTGIKIDSTSMRGYNGTAQTVNIATDGSGWFGLTGTRAIEWTTAGVVTIGDWTINASSISATNITLTPGAANTANITVGTGADAGGLNSPAAGTDIAIWAGSAFANRATAPFRVTAAGALTATSATITGVINAATGYIGGATGWIIAAGKMTSSGIGLATSAGDATYAIWAGDDTPASAEFRVTHAGALVATSATITGAITATSGTIGSFTIGTYLYTGTKTAYNDANAGVHLGSDGIGIANNVFTVSAAGALVATSATITGAITATSGAIGGWSINSTSIYTGTEDHSGYTANAGDITIYSNGTDSSIHAKNFYIDTSGNITATSVTLSGDITATTGYFASVTLGKTGVASGTLTLQLNDAGGDTYINYGKTDFTNTDTGFILGIDDSDSNKGKFYIGDATSYMNWDGSALTYTKGALIENTIQMYTSIASLKTSATAGDGSASSAGIVVTYEGIFGCGANQNATVAAADANVRILADGTAYFGGVITIDPMEDATLGDEISPSTTGATATADGVMITKSVAVTSGVSYYVTWTQTHSVASNGAVTVAIGAASGEAFSFTDTSSHSCSTVIQAVATGTLNFTFTVSSYTSGNIVVADTISLKPVSTSTCSMYIMANDGIAIELRASNSAASDNVFFGRDSGSLNASGLYNTSVGTDSLKYSISGFANTVVGWRAMRQNTTGDDNVAIGRSALSLSQSGSYNVAVGSHALDYNMSGECNVAIGYGAGEWTTGMAGNSGSIRSTYIGYDTRPAANGDTNEIVIGFTAKGGGSNTATLGNTSIVQTILQGGVCIGGASVEAGSTYTLNIKNGTAPDAHVDNQIIVYSVDSSDSAATLGLFLEQAVEDIGTFTASHKIKVKINGTEYWLQLDAV